MSFSGYVVFFRELFSWVMGCITSKPEPVSEQYEDHYFGIKVPNWPYESWKLLESTEDEAADIENNSSPIHSIPDSVGPVFRSFLNSFSHQLDIHNDCTSTEIQIQVRSLLNDSLRELGKSYKCFEKYRLVQAGSVAEKTKIETADEFDFLIVIDYFADEGFFRTVVTQNMVRIYLKDPTIVEFLPFECQNHDGSFDFLGISLRSKFIELFIEIFDERLPSGWRRITNKDSIDEYNEAPCGSGIASTLHLICEKFNLNIDIDLCLCLPLKADVFKEALAVQDVDPRFHDYWKSQMLLFRHLTNITKEAPLELYAILGSPNNAFEAIDTRITAPYLELSCFQSIPPDDGRIKAYCIAKCILSAFLPKLSTIFGCKRCCHRLVRSYHIKNVLLFMLKNYKEDIFWEKGKVALRVLEIFSILEQCLINFDSDSGDSYDAAVAVYGLPGTLYLENVTNSSPLDTEGTRKFFFTPDSHKPLYELSFSPVYQEHLSAGNFEADTLLKEWFDKLNNKTWNSKQLLLDLFKMLKEINKIIQ